MTKPTMTTMARVVRLVLLVSALSAVACSGGGGTSGGRGGGSNGAGGSGGEPVDPALAMKTRHLDEPGLLSADDVNITILPEALAKTIVIEALHRTSKIVGGHEVLVASGRVRVKIRELEIQTEKFEAHVLDEPIEGLKILALGNARYVSNSAASPEEPQATIVLQPSRILYGLD